ncbi:hypothetical protein [Streptomyces sp. OR43]|uniref:hypothetical protein n=1 Tax=Streptomyces sp. or43 TaxID=2478957 RepID=UPI0016517406|nr:hypothetical protein [Streptomyces sp. or43]
MHMDVRRLAHSSQKWMAAAFAALSEGPSSEDLAVHHAGVATEHLLKAFLVSLHPALIADGRDFESVLYATGHGALLQVRGSQVKTIQLGEAYVRVEKILRGKIPPKPKVWPLADARNGVAHCGFHDRTEVTAVFTSCLKVIDPLLAELGLGSRYWGPYKSMHDKLLDQHVEAARIRLEGKLVKARSTFEDRYGYLDDKERELVLVAIANVASPETIEHDEPAACPACSTQGWLGGASHVPEHATTVYMTPEVFDCRACDLHLQLEELDLLKEPLGGDIDLKVSPEDYYADYEPEWSREDFEDDGPDEDAMVDAYMNR